MRRFNKITMAGAMALVIGVTSITGFAATKSTTPVGIRVERTEEFRNERFAEKKSDTTMKALEEKRVNCDGSGGQRRGQKEGRRGQGGMRLRDGTCCSENIK